MSSRPLVDRLRRRHHDESASAPIEFSFGAALLLFPMLLLGVSLPPLVDAASAGQALAAESARLLAVHGPDAVDEVAALVARTDQTRAGTFRWAPADGGLARTPEAVTVTIRTQLPVLTVPGLGVLRGWTVSRSHTEPLDPYRSRP